MNAQRDADAGTFRLRTAVLRGAVVGGVTFFPLLLIYAPGLLGWPLVTLAKCVLYSMMSGFVSAVASIVEQRTKLRPSSLKRDTGGALVIGVVAFLSNALLALELFHLKFVSSNADQGLSVFFKSPYAVETWIRDDPAIFYGSSILLGTPFLLVAFGRLRQLHVIKQIALTLPAAGLLAVLSIGVEIFGMDSIVAFFGPITAIALAIVVPFANRLADRFDKRGARAST